MSSTYAQEQYWETTIRRIFNEIKTAHDNYEELKVTNEKPLEEMTLSELKEKIKCMCLVTKLKKREKIVDFIKSNL